MKTISERTDDMDDSIYDARQSTQNFDNENFYSPYKSESNNTVMASPNKSEDSELHLQNSPSENYNRTPEFSVKKIV